MAEIGSFLSKLKGGGARSNQFKVTMPFPGFAATGGETESMAFLCKATSIPESTVGEVLVPFRGRNIYLAGDRTFATWDTTIINDSDFLIRNAIERWLNGINNHSDNEGLVNPVDYQVDAFVDHLDRNGNTIKSYTFRGLYPTNLQAITLDYAEATALEEFVCSWRYQHWEASTTT